MSDKAFSKLTPTDQIIRQTISATRESVMGEDGTLLTISFVSGFEKFNTRPYHNYEAWGDGYRIEGRGVTVEREDLDDAIREWYLQVWESYIESPPKPTEGATAPERSPS